MALLCHSQSSHAHCRSLSSRHRNTLRVAAVATAPPGANPSAGPPQEIVRISPQLLEAGGLDPSTQDPQNIAAFSSMLDKVLLLAAGPCGAPELCSSSLCLMEDVCSMHHASQVTCRCRQQQAHL